jgi:hypothetical protein
VTAGLVAAVVAVGAGLVGVAVVVFVRVVRRAGAVLAATETTPPRERPPTRARCICCHALRPVDELRYERAVGYLCIDGCEDAA